jgi:uncharacterized protein (TIRG00374 family)
VRKLQFLAGLAISALALYFVLHDVHWSSVRDALKDADYGLVGLAAVLLVVTIAMRAVRWRRLFHPPLTLPLWQVFGSMNVGYFINNVLPLQMGDLGRAYLVSELASVSTTRSFSTVVVERILDVLTLLLLLLFIAPFVPVPGWARAPAITLAAGFSLLAVILIGLSLKRERALASVRRLLRLAPAPSRAKLEQMAGSALQGFSVLAKPQRAAALLAYSLLCWLTVGLVVYLGMLAFELGEGFGAALLVLVATSFGFFVPSSPGSFGVYHAIVIGTLTSVFHVDKSLAVSYALVIHAVFYLPPMLLGPLFLWTERALWRRVSFFDKLAELRGAQPDTAPTAELPGA